MKWTSGKDDRIARSLPNLVCIFSLHLQQVVMDVEGFKDSDLTVKSFSPMEIVVEGKQETSDGCTFSSKSFSRRFNLPSNALIEDASSNLSSDGVLTITVPKKVSSRT